MIIVELVVLVVALVVVVLAFILRHTIPGRNYGTYVAGNSTCVKADSCTNPGVSITLSQCEPDPLTGNGCDDGTGRQTFATRISRDVCQPTCQKSGWGNEFTFPCQTTGPCTVTGIGSSFVTKTCLSLDASGFDGCVLTGTEAELQLYASQPGCRRNGSSVVCQPGTIIEVSQPCILEGVPRCGDWKVPGSDAIGCFDDGATYTEQCYKDDGTLYTNYLDLFSQGVITPNMACVDMNNAPAQCQPLPCVPTATLANVGNPLCGNPYKCIRRCVYFGTGVPGIPTTLQRLTGSFFTIQDINTTGYMAPVHSLCGSSSLYGTPSMADFGDCLAAKGSTPSAIEVGLIRPDIAINAPTLYDIHLDCTATDVVAETAFIFTAKPVGSSGGYDSMELYAFLEGRLGVIDNTWNWNPNLTATAAVLNVQWPGSDQEVYALQMPIIVSTINRQTGRTSTIITSFRAVVLDSTGDASALQALRRQRNCSLLYKNPIPANY